MSPTPLPEVRAEAHQEDSRITTSRRQPRWLSVLSASPTSRYLTALCSAGCGYLLWLGVGHLIERASFQLMLPFVAISAWIGGLGPGLLTCLICALLVLPTPLSFSEHLALILFCVVGSLFTLLCGSLSRARSEAETTAEHLRQSEQSYRQIVETANEGVWVVDNRFHTLFVNSHMAEMLGTTPEAMRSRPITDWVYEEDLPIFQQNIGQLQSQPHIEYERRYLHSNGSEVWCLLNITSRFDNQGRFIGALAMCTDVTERHRITEELSEINARFELASQATAGFLYEWNAQTDQVWRSNAVEDILGYRQATPHIDWWRQQIHPLDSAVVQSQLMAMRNKSGAPIPNETLTLEYRARHANGSYRWLWDRGAIERHPDGTIRRIVGWVLDITDRKESENRLAESEERFRQLSETIPHIVVVTAADSSPEFYSHSWYEYTGLPAGSLSPKDWRNHMHPDDLPAIEEAWSFSRETGIPYESEGRIRGVEGQYRWFLGKMVAVRDDNGQIVRWLGTCTDIHDRKREENEQRLLAKLGPVLSSSLDLDTMLRSLADTLIPDWADQSMIFLRRGPHQLELRALSHFLPDHAPMLWQHYTEDLAIAGPVDVQENGHPNWIEHADVEKPLTHAASNPHTEILHSLGYHSMLSFPLIASGRTLGVVSLAWARMDAFYNHQDIALFDEIGARVAAAIENANLYRELQEADRRKDDFLAMLAHELRNPMAAITGARVLLDDLLTGEAAEATELPRAIMERQLNQLTRLLDDLLDVSRITRGRIDLRRERIDLVLTIQSAVEAAEPLIRSKGHTLTVDLPESPVWMQGDSARLGQVTLNLLVNAAKYTDPGGRIDLILDTLIRGGRFEACLRVRDNGTGLAPEMLDDVWQLFVQSERTLDRAQGGLGIGLTLVKALVEMHGGKVAVLSEGLGLGSEFQVLLPVENIVPKANLAQTTSSNGVQGASSAAHNLMSENTASPAVPDKHKILVVDDNRDAAQMLGVWLRARGYDVDFAHDGEAGLERALEWRPDVALLDIGMPGLNGYQLAERLRIVLDYPIFLVAITGYGQPDDQKKAESAGFNRHMTKPISFKFLEGLLQESLNTKS